MVKYLVSEGKCSVNEQNKEFDLSNDEFNPTSGSTPLHAASFYGHLDIVKYLIDHGADYFIQNHAKETPMSNGLFRENVKAFFEDYLIFSYSNCPTIPPMTTISNEKEIVCDCIWEYKSICSDQWISFDQNQSKKLQKCLLYQDNHNYNSDLIIEIKNQSHRISILQILSFVQSSKEYLWIRCRGSSILNFNSYSKWQILFSSSEKNETSSLDVFNLDSNENIPLKIEFNHWYNVNDYLGDEIENGINYRKKLLLISLPFLHNELFEFNLKIFSFENTDRSISGFLRWIPFFISNNDQTIIDNFQPLDNLFLTPKYRTHQSTTLNKQGTSSVSYFSFTFKIK